MLSDQDALRMLEGEAPAGPVCEECDAAHARGFQAGLIAAREPWVAIFFGVAGFSVGYLVASLAHG